MSVDDKKTRNKILKTTYEMIVKEDMENITVRRISEQAGVAVSAVNYHFQNKENLIALAIVETIGSIVNLWKERYLSLDKPPIIKAKIILNESCKFIYENQRVTKIILLKDLLSGSENDNTSQSITLLILMLNEIFDGNNYPKKSDLDIRIIAYQITSAVHIGFFRQELIKKESGLDFSKERDIYKYIETVFDNIVKPCKER
jgi:AcrR family transcriptional regulator